MLLPRPLTLLISLVACSAISFAQWSLETLTQAKRDSGVASVGRYLLFAGGSTAVDAVTDIVDVFDAQTRMWSTQQLSLARTELGAASYDGRAYLAGGRQDPSVVYDRIDVFEAETQAWSRLTLPQARFALGSAAANGVVLFAGGHTGSTASDRADWLDLANGTWHSATLSEARMSPVVVAVEHEILVVGGYASSGRSNAVDIFDTLTGLWRTDAIPGTTLIDSGDSVADQGFFAGGNLTSGGLVHVYQGSTQSWSSFALSMPRDSIAVLAFGNRVLFAGGESFPNTQTLVDVYDTLTGALSVEHMPDRRHRAMAGAVYGRAVFAGGLREGNLTAAVNVYEPQIGSSLCGPAVPNSTGASASIRASGSKRAGGEPLALIAERLPAEVFTLFMTASTLAPAPLQGSQGILCLGAPLGRFAERIASSESAGQVSIEVDTQALPIHGGTLVQPGETWYFQAWFREPAGSSNLTDAVAILFD